MYVMDNIEFWSCGFWSGYDDFEYIMTCPYEWAWNIFFDVCTYPGLMDVKICHRQEVFTVPARYTQYAVIQSQVDVGRVKEGLGRSKQLFVKSDTIFE